MASSGQQTASPWPGTFSFILLLHLVGFGVLAAVDNTTRKLMADAGPRRPLSVGFWFSLGYSTIVFGLAFLLSVGCGP